MEQASINTRATARQRELVDQAVEDVLLNRTLLPVDASTFAKLEALRDKPLPPTDKLRRLFKAKAPWEK